MSDSVYKQVECDAKYLGLDLPEQEIAQFSADHNLSEEELTAVADVFHYLKNKRNESTVSALLKMSRLPLKDPKTFGNFDFSLLKGDKADILRNLPNLSDLYARKNLAFIGPPGTGKTHLAMAYGRACCERGMKTYFLKATELNQKLTEARKHDHVSSAVNGLVKPSCLIIDEIGRCRFDLENTRLFFDVIDRRYNKDCPNTMIFTSNMTPDKWRECFSEDETLLCAVDRFFDKATVFMFKGDSYRGKSCQTVALTVGNSIPNTK